MVTRVIISSEYSTLAMVPDLLIHISVITVPASFVVADEHDGLPQPPW